MNHDSLYEVKSIVRKGKKYEVSFFNLEEKLQLFEDQIVEYRIIKGNQFAMNEIEKIKKSSEIAHYYNKVIHFINFKPRTEKEVRNYLKEAEVSEYDSNKIIGKLKEVHFIDDFRFATRFTEELIRKQKGRFGIYQTLLQKGLDKTLIEESLKQYLPEVEKSNALEIAKKLTKLYTSYPVKKQKLQIMQKLASSGYSQEMINYALNSVVFETDFEDRLIKEYHKLVLKNVEKEKIIAKLLAKGYEYSDIKKIMNT